MMGDMKVLMLNREFNDGDFVSEYVKSISRFIINKNFSVNLVCFGGAEEKLSIAEKFNVIRVNLLIHGNNLFNWVMLMNKELERAGREIYELEGFDIIHANDWTTVPAAISLSRLTDRPFVLSMHSTEKERGFGIDYSGLIYDVENMGVHEAAHIIADKEQTKNILINDFGIDKSKIDVINPFSEAWESKIMDVYKKLCVVKV